MLKITNDIKKTENILFYHFAGLLDENALRRCSISMIGALHVFLKSGKSDLYSIKKELLLFRECYINMIELFEEGRWYSNIYDYMQAYNDPSDDILSEEMIISEFPLMFDHEKQEKAADLLLGEVLKNNQNDEDGFMIFMKKFSRFIVYSYISESEISVFSHFTMKLFNCVEEKFANIIIDETLEFFSIQLNNIYGKPFVKSGFLQEHIFWSIPDKVFDFFSGKSENFDFDFSAPENQFTLSLFSLGQIEHLTSVIIDKYALSSISHENMNLQYKMSVLIFHFLSKILKNRTENL